MFLFFICFGAGDYSSILSVWKLGGFIDAFRDQGCDEIEDWDDLIANKGEKLSNLIGMRPGHVKKFLQKYNTYQMEKRDKPLPILTKMTIKICTQFVIKINCKLKLHVD